MATSTRRREGPLLRDRILRGYDLRIALDPVPPRRHADLRGGDVRGRHARDDQGVSGHAVRTGGLKGWMMRGVVLSGLAALAVGIVVAFAAGRSDPPLPPAPREAVKSDRV